MSRDKSKLDKTRRDFLRTASHAGLSMSLLKTSALATGMMLGRTAAASGATGIDKVVFCYIGGGAPVRGGRSLFIPSSNLVLPAASAPLESVKRECVFFSDATVAGGGGHGNTSKVLGGSTGKDSYDVELERTLGANSPFPSVLLGVQSNDGNHGSATKREHREVTYQDNPIAAFNRLFAGGGNAPSGGGASIETLRSQRVLDIQKAEIAQLKNVLGSSERIRLDEHLNSIEKIEARLAATTTSAPPTSACGSPNWAGSNYNYNPSDKTRFTELSELQMDLTALALRCNHTKIVSLMFGNHQSDHTVTGLNWTDTYHQSIHGGSVETHTETRAYLSGRLAYLINALKNTTDDVGKSLLDSTLVVQVTDMGDGNAHNSTNAPMLIAGGGSAIRRGQLTRCGSHVNILDTVTEALDLTGQVKRFGGGPLSGIIT